MATTTKVYVRSDDPSLVYEEAEILSQDSSAATVRLLNQSGETDERILAVALASYPDSTLPLINLDPTTNLLQSFADMSHLPSLSEPSILFNIRKRSLEGQPYTFCGGGIVVSVNPYEWQSDRYSWEKMRAYAKIEKDVSPPPHVYHTSAAAYHSLTYTRQNQSILVSGESGAGKTESVKILLRHIAAIQGVEAEKLQVEQAVSSSTIVRKIVETTPLLEAFGNAKTVRNDNSSRFGKFIKLQFRDNSPTSDAIPPAPPPLLGSISNTYLLEKSRLVSHSEGERSFHVFYELLSLDDKERAEIWEGLRGVETDHFAYLRGGESDVKIEGFTNAERWAKTSAALSLIGISGASFKILARAICIVLQVGNVKFVTSESNSDATKIVNDGALSNLSTLMGATEVDLEKALTHRTVEANKESFDVPLTAVEAASNRDSWSKDLYSRIFCWLVDKINAATASSDDSDGGWIGLLDIFGFESFQINRFEQLCINYCNEKIQQKFTSDVFRSVMAEYESEGIEFSEISYEDNSNVLSMIEGPGMGLINILNEECVRPKGSDESFVYKAYMANDDEDIPLIRNKRFSKHQFGIKHYAGDVIYDANEFVKKNQDSTPKAMVDISSRSSNDLVATLMRESLASVAAATKGEKHARRGSTIAQNTLWSKFKVQLNELMKSLGKTNTRYIRCIKPNARKLPRTMDNASTVEQLRCAGVISAISVSREAFPNRMLHATVVEKFACLSSEVIADTSELTAAADAVKILAELFTGDESGFVCGKTCIYFRKGNLEKLEQMRLVMLSSSTTKIQSFFLMAIKRCRYLSTRDRIIMLQAFVRGGSRRFIFSGKKAAAVRIQCAFRLVKACLLLRSRRENAKASAIQFFCQGRIARFYARRRFLNLRADVVAIQAITRRRICVSKYKNDVAEWREAQKMENQLKILQKKLEMKDAELREARSASSTGGLESSLLPSSSVTSPSGTSGQLMQESEQMLEYLRNELFKVRQQNTALSRENAELKTVNKRLEDANSSAGASFAALNQHAKQLSKSNRSLSREVKELKVAASDANVRAAEFRDEMKMKHHVYAEEVENRLRYQQAVSDIVRKLDRRKGDEKYENLKQRVLVIARKAEGDRGDGLGAGMGVDVARIKTPAKRASIFRSPNKLDKVASLSASSAHSSPSSSIENKKFTSNQAARNLQNKENTRNSKPSSGSSMIQLDEGVVDDVKALGNVFSSIFSFGKNK